MKGPNGCCGDGEVDSGCFPRHWVQASSKVGWGDEAGVLVVDQGFVDGFAGLVHSGVRLS